MAQITRLDDADIAEIARRFRLGAVADVHALWAGTINSNYRFKAEPCDCFVRVNEGKSEDEVAYEADLVSQLAGQGVPTPRALVADDGRHYARCAAGLITVFPWVAGEHVTGGTLRPAHTRAVGAALARLHLAGRGYPIRRESRYAFASISERWRRSRAQAGVAPDVERVLADLGAEIAWLDERAPARGALPGGIIHGDLFPDNVLFEVDSVQDQEADRLAALLDFEQASDGCLLFDLAVCLCAWCYGESFSGELAAALCAGYQEVRPLSADERALFFVEARAAALRFTVTRITDVELNPQASPEIRKAKDFRRFHARLEALRRLGEGGFADLVKPRAS